MAPPTFAIIVAQRADAQLIEDPESGIDFSRVVHADQRFIHHRPIVAGDGWSPNCTSTASAPWAAAP